MKKIYLLAAQARCVVSHAKHVVNLMAFAFALAPLTSMAVTNYYVATNGPGIYPCTNWAMATNSIQAAINFTLAGDTVWVSNGVYNTDAPTEYGGSNRVVISKAITVRSANNDPAHTIIQGVWSSDGNTNGPDAVRCVAMFDCSSILIGFMLTNGATKAGGSGGGIKCDSVLPVISNCIIICNSADSSAGGVNRGTLYNCQLNKNTGSSGGGTYQSILYNCTLNNNYASAAGGGAYNGTLYNCTLNTNSTVDPGGGTYNATLYNCIVSSNSANRGGGIYGGTAYNCLLAGNYANEGGGAGVSILYNCTVVGNQAINGGGVRGNSTAINCIVYFNDHQASGAGSNWYGTIWFTNSCTTTAVVDWASGNITADPLFITNGSGYGIGKYGPALIPGDYHLTPNSPCANAGNNAYVTTNIDLDGHSRIDHVWGKVDMGCYEFIPSITLITIPCR
jgi:hypothetical protein